MCGMFVCIASVAVIGGIVAFVTGTLGNKSDSKAE